MRPTAKHPVGQLVFALVASIQINQLLHQIGPTLKCDALRMINLDAPQMALRGDTIRLTCSFSLADEPTTARGSRRTGKGSGPNGARNDLVAPKPPLAAGGKRFAASGGGSHGDDLFDRPSHRWPRSTPSDDSDSTPELLYAIKWYKDEREFYQFVTKNWPHKHALPMAGLDIDVDKSDNQTVVLKSVSLKTSGLFRCEVSTDAPSFMTKSIERKIFIYSLPAEGPVIETSLPRTRPNQLSLHLGDQLEFRCLSRESKPNTELDWIINDSWNLTAKSPVGTSGSPLFKVTNRRFIRLPKLATNQERSSPGSKIISTRNQSVIANTVIQFNSIQQQQAINETTYELIGTRGRAVARPLSGSESSSVVPINVESLDQFLETSMSILSFTVDTDLTRHLHMYSSKEPPIRSHRQNLLAHKAADGRSQANRTSLGTSSFKTRKVNADQGRSNANSNGHLDSGPRLPLDIRCVARVLHLSMSDEIKLRVVNRTKDALPNVSSAIESHRQEKRTQSNSGVTDATWNQWVYFAFCLIWITIQGI